MPRRDAQGRFASAAAESPYRQSLGERRLDALMDSFARLDNWGNFYAGIGVKGRDPSLADRVLPPIEIVDQEVEWLYRSDAMAARAVDVIVDDALRQGWDVKIHDDKSDPAELSDMAEGVEAYQRKLKTRKRIRRSAVWGRLFGGGALVMGVDDGQSDFSQPVNEARIQAVRWLHPVPRPRITKTELEEDTSSEFFGEAKMYDVQLNDSGEVLPVHASRLILFSGAYKPALEGAWNDWDDSVLLRLWAPLKDFAMSYAGVARIIRTFNTIKYKIAGLTTAMSQNKTAAIRRRLEIAELSMSILNALLMDADKEDTEIMQRPVTGLPELLDRQGIRLTAATGMPITKLLGLSPGGFGTGEDEDRRWGDIVRFWQQDELGPGLERLTKFIMLAKDGPTAGVLPEKWNLTFRPLKAPSEKERSEIQKIIAEARAILIREGVLLPDEVAEGMWGKGEFSTDLQLDRELREEFERAAEEARKNLPPPPPPGSPPPDEPSPEGGEAPDDDAADPATQEDSLRDALEATRRSDAAPRLAHTAVRILESVEAGRLSPNRGATLLGRLCGFPWDEAEALVTDSTPRLDRVEKRGGKWLVLSVSGRVLGQHATEAEAREQLQAIEAAKAARSAA